MYHGTNPTALQSQRWLAESLIALMEVKPYCKITIMNICKQADLSRQTFYNFFNTKEEVLRFCLQSQYEHQFRRFHNQSTISIDETVEAFAAVLVENRELLMAMIENDLDGIIADEIAKCVALFAVRFVKEGKVDEMLPYSEALLSGALAHLLVYWIRQDLPISIEKLNHLVTDFLAGRLFDFD